MYWFLLSTARRQPCHGLTTPPDGRRARPIGARRSGRFRPSPRRRVAAPSGRPAPACSQASSAAIRRTCGNRRSRPRRGISGADPSNPSRPRNRRTPAVAHGSRRLASWSRCPGADAAAGAPPARRAEAKRIRCRGDRQQPRFLVTIPVPMPNASIARSPAPLRRRPRPARATARSASPSLVPGPGQHDSSFP